MRRSGRGRGLAVRGQRKVGKLGETRTDPEKASRGLWWALGALVAVASSSMLLHESASWTLDFALFEGVPINVRAFSCNAHSLGLVFGYALTQINAARFRRAVLEPVAWTLFFLMQFVDVLAFYWLMAGMGPVFAVVPVQFLGAAFGAIFFVVTSQAAEVLDGRRLIAAVIATIGGTTLIVQGVFSVLESNVPLLVSEFLHLGLLVAGGLCSVRAMARGACLRLAWEDTAFLPIRSQSVAAGGTASADAKAPLSTTTPPPPASEGALCGDGGDGLPCRQRRVPLCWRLFLILGVYGAVFGFLHVVPLALPLGVVARVSSFLVGMGAALALLVLTLPPARSLDMSRIWNRFYRVVFPVATVAALLGPLTASTEFLPALVMQACALYYFDALLAVGCYAVCRVLRAAPSQVFGRAFLIRSIGFLLGNLVGMGVHENLVLDTAAFSVIGTAVFVLLVLVTFNMNSEKYAKTVWGLLPHEDPRGRYERTRDERCTALAAQFGLTEREAEVLRLLARSKRPREISDVLVVSVATVRSHVHAIYTKTGVHSAAELAKLVECPQDKS